MLAGFVALSFLLSGCSTLLEKQDDFKSLAADEAQWKADHEKCLAAKEKEREDREKGKGGRFVISLLAGGIGGAVGDHYGQPYQLNRLYNSCMEAKGYKGVIGSKRADLADEKQWAEFQKENGLK